MVLAGLSILLKAVCYQVEVFVKPPKKFTQLTGFMYVKKNRAGIVLRSFSHIHQKFKKNMNAHDQTTKH